MMQLISQPMISCQDPPANLDDLQGSDDQVSRQSAANNTELKPNSSMSGPVVEMILSNPMRILNQKADAGTLPFLRQGLTITGSVKLGFK
ncbi:unnamed protein product [Allacma fusca]|uniref:Uncharacterized protein n=1 Tax=Allacma fusca TaxID=39272 RepID=A0A8J2JQ50_9HEXA|nr:unnamed protein product [Allacma fusca]